MMLAMDDGVVGDWKRGEGPCRQQQHYQAAHMRSRLATLFYKRPILPPFVLLHHSLGISTAESLHDARVATPLDEPQTPVSSSLPEDVILLPESGLSWPKCQPERKRLDDTVQCRIPHLHTGGLADTVELRLFCESATMRRN